MQGGQRLLLDRLDRHGVDSLVATRLQDRDRIGPVRLVAVPITRDVGGRKQTNTMAERLELPTPVVGRPACLHEHLAALGLGKEATKAFAREPVMRIDPSWRRRNRNLKDRLCQVDRYLRTVHRAPPLILAF